MRVLIVDDDIALEPLSLEHVKAIFEVIDGQREYLGKWLPFVANTRNPGDTRDYVKSVVNVPSNQREHVYSIIYRGEFAGLIGTKDTCLLNKRTEIGYWLSEPLQGKGIVTRSLRCLMEKAFDTWDLNRVQIRVAVGNAPSNKIPKKFGFILEGIERKAERMADGSFVDINIYSKLRPD